MDFLTIYVKFQLNKALYSWLRGRIVAQKYDWTIFHISQHIHMQKSTSSPQGRAEQAQRDSQRTEGIQFMNADGEKKWWRSMGGNGPCARKLEAILAGFGRQVRLQELRDMKPNLITS